MQITKVAHCNLHQDNSWRLEQLECLHSENTPAAPWLAIPWIHIGSQVKTRLHQSYKFKEFAKNSYFLILKETLHATHLLKLLDKVCKYEMDPACIVEDTEWTWFCPQTDRWADRRSRWNQYTPFNFVQGWVGVGGIITWKVKWKWKHLIKGFITLIKVRSSITYLSNGCGPDLWTYLQKMTAGG